MNRREFLKWTAAGALGAAGTAAAASVASWGTRGLAPSDIEVVRVKVDRPLLPPSFDGLKIAILADIHYGSSGISNALVEKSMELTMAQQPDLVLFGGDLITGWASANSLAELLAIARDIRAPLGVFGVLGNHEFLWGQKEATRHFERSNIRLLRNETASLSRGRDHIRPMSGTSAPVAPEALIRLTGLDNMFNQKMDRVERLAGDICRDKIEIVLEHTPDMASVMGKNFKGLLLSGHTHGGQIIFPGIGQTISVSRFGLKYVSGLYPVGGGLMYVTRGIGAVSIPVRIGCPPEVTILELAAVRTANT